MHVATTDFSSWLQTFAYSPCWNISWSFPAIFLMETVRTTVWNTSLSTWGDVGLSKPPVACSHFDYIAQHHCSELHSNTALHTSEALPLQFPISAQWDSQLMAQQEGQNLFHNPGIFCSVPGLFLSYLLAELFALLQRKQQRGLSNSSLPLHILHCRGHKCFFPRHGFAFLVTHSASHAPLYGRTYFHLKVCV